MQNFKKLLPRICFLGCGNIAARHAKILKNLYPSIDISFASRSKFKSREFAEKFGSRKYFASYKEALKSDLFDIAFITTPHAYHSELAVEAAEYSKDIIIEKPAARTIREFHAIEIAVKKNKVRCAIAENYYYKPFIKKIRKYIDDGVIGDILFIEINKTNRDNVTGWRSDKEMMGGGALLEGGVHWINAICSLAASSPSEVIAFRPNIFFESNIPFEDSIMLNIAFENGIVGKLLHSWNIINPLKGISLSKIYGTSGVITFESNGLFFFVHGKKKRAAFINPSDFLGFKAMHKAFIEDYINENPWEPSLSRIKEELKLIESAYKSLRSKCIEKL